MKFFRLCLVAACLVALGQTALADSSNTYELDDWKCGNLVSPESAGSARCALPLIGVLFVGETYRSLIPFVPDRQIEVTNLLVEGQNGGEYFMPVDFDNRDQATRFANALDSQKDVHIVLHSTWFGKLKVVRVNSVDGRSFTLEQFLSRKNPQ